MRCPACATENPAAAAACSQCGAKLARPARRRGNAASFDFSTVAFAHNPPGVAAYRCALYGLIPVAGLFLGALALILGIFGYRRARADAEKKGIGHAWTGIILGALELVSNGAGIAFLWMGLSSLAQ